LFSGWSIILQQESNGSSIATGGADRVDNFMVEATPVPEPQGLALVGGLSLLAMTLRRRREQCDLVVVVGWL